MASSTVAKRRLGEGGGGDISREIEQKLTWLNAKIMLSNVGEIDDIFVVNSDVSLEPKVGDPKAQVRDRWGSGVSDENRGRARTSTVALESLYERMLREGYEGSPLMGFAGEQTGN